MRRTEVAIVGGGLAGSLAAAMLGASGIDAILIDPHPSYPPDFRCEKLDEGQAVLLRATGLADRILPAATHDREVWVARMGRLAAKKRYEQYNILYPDLVNTVRRAISPVVPFIVDKVSKVTLSDTTQNLILSSGEEIEARLVIMANGLNNALRQELGMARLDISPCHSVSIGFDLRPAQGRTFDFTSLTYFAEKPADRMAYLALFPIGEMTRANYFVYRSKDDLWFREMRRFPVETMSRAMPRLQGLTGDFDVTSPVTIRPVDLYVTQAHRRAGVVLVGDAFATSCPAAGTGTSKVLIDAERLCRHHIPGWLATAGMGEEKIGAFYDDPIKRTSDASSTRRAFFLRSLSLNTGLAWQARRGVRFVRQVAIGRLLREVQDRLPGVRRV